MDQRRLESGVVLRHLHGDDELEQCLELQRRTWGSAFNELVPPTILKISQKIGGVMAGAFDERAASSSTGKLLGFVYGMTGIRAGRIAHWSHMLAVLPEARSLGLGKQLKMFQREHLLELGVEVMYWTYDPLVARNANLNLNRLGARPVEYVIDMYGSNTGSDLHSGLGSDRFIVEWELAAPTVRALLDETAPTRNRPTAALGNPTAEGQVNSERAAAQPRERPLGEHPAVWVEVPADIEKTKARDSGEALAWRTTSRRAFTHYLGKGYRVSGLVFLEADGERRYFYRLDRPGAEGPE